MGKRPNKVTYDAKGNVKETARYVFDGYLSFHRSEIEALYKRHDAEKGSSQKGTSRSNRRLPELPADPVVASLPASELAPPSSALLAVPVALLLALGFLLVRRFTKPHAEKRSESSEPKDLDEW